MKQGELGPGARIDDRYVLRRRLGVGGFGAVWLATDEKSRSITKELALKILHPQLRAGSAVVSERFEQEAQVLSRLDHPSIVRPLAFSAMGEHAYLAMEYVEGLPLDRVLKECARRKEHLETHEVVRIFDELAAAVQYIHGEGVVHRDLKPSNVMLVRRAGRAFVKMLDLGIARLLEPSGRDATTVGRMLGSLYYASPEQVRGEGADERSDVFALGVILFELVTSCRTFVVDDGRPASADRPPFRSEANTPSRVFERITSGERPKPSDAREGIPLELDAIVARALAVDPGDRFSSAASLAQAALPFLRNLESTHGTTIFALGPDLDATADEVQLATEALQLSTTHGGREVTEPEPPSQDELRSARDPRVQRTSVGPVDSTQAGMESLRLDARDQRVQRTSVGPVDSTQAGMESLHLDTQSRRRSRWLELIGVATLVIAVGVIAFVAGTVQRTSEPEVRGAAPAPVSSPGAVPRVVAREDEAATAEPRAAETREPEATPAPSEEKLAAPASDPTRQPRSPTPPRPDEKKLPTSPTGNGPEAVTPRATTELGRLLQRAREAPSDLARVAALGDAVREELKRLPAGALRTRLERRTETSAMDGNVEGLAECVDGLESALHARER